MAAREMDLSDSESVVGLDEELEHWDDDGKIVAPRDPKDIAEKLEIIENCTKIGVKEIVGVIFCYAMDYMILTSLKPDKRSWLLPTEYCTAQSSVLQFQRILCEIEVAAPGPVVKELVRYIKAHGTKLVPKIKYPINSTHMEEMCVCPWDAWFINRLSALDKTRKTLNDLIFLAVRFDMQSLQNLGVCKMAALLKGCRTDELHTVLGQVREEEKDFELSWAAKNGVEAEELCGSKSPGETKGRKNDAEQIIESGFNLDSEGKPPPILFRGDSTDFGTVPCNCGYHPPECKWW